jgi:hypothetical protein
MTWRVTVAAPWLASVSDTEVITKSDGSQSLRVGVSAGAVGQTTLTVEAVDASGNAIDDVTVPVRVDPAIP